MSILQWIVIFLTYPQLRSKKHVEQTEAKRVETNKLFQEKLDESKEIRNNAKDDEEQIQEESGHVVRTYILVGALEISY